MVIVGVSSEPPRARTMAVTAPAPAAATIQIHFFDLPLLCGKGGGVVGRVSGVAGRGCACGMEKAALATRTGLFGRGAGAARSATCSTGSGASSPFPAKAAGSSIAVIIVTMRTVVAGIHFEWAFNGEFDFIAFTSCYVFKAVQSLLKMFFRFVSADTFI
jgi:hypothetical protein